MTNLVVASQDFQLSKRSWKKLENWWHEGRMADGRDMLEVDQFILPLLFRSRAMTFGTGSKDTRPAEAGSVLRAEGSHNAHGHKLQQ